MVLDSKSAREADAPIVRGEAARYELKLRRPWVTARGTWTYRRGWLVKLKTADGRVGFGDCAPLPELHTEDLTTTEQRLRDGFNAFTGIAPNHAFDRLSSWKKTPAARFALETALLDLLAQAEGVSLSRWLLPNAARVVRVNAALGALDESTAVRAREAVAQGYRVLKLKVGVGVPEKEQAQLRALSVTLPPDVTLRLDANGSWEAPQARQVLAALCGLPVESVEEPLKSPDRKRLRQLQESAPFPLAVDESLPSWTPDELLSDPPVRRLVLKPMVLGGLLPALGLARRAEEAGVECVVTSTLDSGAGVWAAVHLAAALGNPLAHGLTTREWLVDDIGSGPVIEQARIVIPDVPGLGFAPSQEVRFG